MYCTQKSFFEVPLRPSRRILFQSGNTRPVRLDDHRQSSVPTVVFFFKFVVHTQYVIAAKVSTRISRWHYTTGRTRRRFCRAHNTYIYFFLFYTVHIKCNRHKTPLSRVSVRYPTCPVVEHDVRACVFRLCFSRRVLIRTCK